MDNAEEIVSKNLTLDPANWETMRQLGHRMLDDMFDHLEHIRDKPAWRKMPGEAKAFFEHDIPQQPEQIEKIYDEFLGYIFPYNKGNIHPRFFAWVQGTGTPFGVLSEMLAATMNPNMALGEHAAMYVERQVLKWCKQLLHYPETSSGILLSGGSMANITALAVAKDKAFGKEMQKPGGGQPLIYCSTETHSCFQKAVEVLGLGSGALRKIPVNKDYQINIDALVKAINEDRARGDKPFCIVGNAGTVNTGAIDPLNELMAICKQHDLWFHIDGAFGALAKLVPEYALALKAIEEADSIAFDFHKWMYMPYEIGCVLIRDEEAHRNTFTTKANYLLTQERGLAAGPEPFNNYGMELSRGFKALKVWMCLKEHGLEKYGQLIRQNIAQAFYMGSLIENENRLELLSPVTMNIVCYRYIKEGLSTEQLNGLNKELLMQLQEQGIALPSSTILNGKYAIRVAIVNQRSQKSDFELLVKETIRIGDELNRAL